MFEDTRLKEKSMLVQIQAKKGVSLRAPCHTTSNVCRLVGSKAVAGAMTRMSKISNRSRRFRHTLSPIGFGQWGDWDNGHSDG